MSATETQGASATSDRPKTAKKTRGPRAKRAELTPEQRELTEKFMPLAMSLSKLIKLKWSQHRDDIDATARLALVEAAQAYNPRRGVSFTHFARFRIIGAIRDLERYLFNKAYPRQLPDIARAFHYVPGEHESGMLMLMSREGTVGRRRRVGRRGRALAGRAAAAARPGLPRALRHRPDPDRGEPADRPRQVARLHPARRGARAPAQLTRRPRGGAGDRARCGEELRSAECGARSAEFRWRRDATS